MELFFIFLVFRVEDGVEFQALDRSYASADACVEASGPMLSRAKQEHPNAVGALCWTLDEFSESSYLPMKRPL